MVFRGRHYNDVEPMTYCIRKIANEVLGELKGNDSNKETQWLILEVHEAMQEKRHCYRVWWGTKNTKSNEVYMNAKDEFKKVLKDANSKAYDDLCDKLGTREKEIFSNLQKREKEKVGTQVISDV